MQKLVADIMLAKLARWLRIVGVEVENTPYSNDDRIINYVRRRHALLLTQDRALSLRSKRRKFKVLLAQGRTLDEQLAFTAHKLGVRLDVIPEAVCPICNSKLSKVNRSLVIDKIPESARQRRKFYFCANCKKVYWKGTHFAQIKNRLAKARQLQKKLGQ